VRVVHRVLFVLGWPARLALIGLLRLYRVALRPLIGGGCRFHPTCSVYAEDAIRGAGAIRGSVLAAWRVARCSPLTRGGVDWAPVSSDWPFLYEKLARPSEVYDPVILPSTEPAR
jgi:putative membrane protein insertion efficiency factor